MEKISHSSESKRKTTEKANEILGKKSYEDYFPDISCGASATECTGLMPTPPENDNELLSYQDLYSMEIPKTNGK